MELTQKIDEQIKGLAGKNLQSAGENEKSFRIILGKKTGTFLNF